MFQTLTYLIYPLSGIMGNTMEALRMSSARMGGTISSSAFALACFFFGFRLIKMYYDIVSDEQHGGFGGIRVWDILRPILILLLISGYSWVVIKPVDSLASATSGLIGGGMTATISSTTKDIGAGFREAFDEKKLEGEKKKEENKEGFFKALANWTGLDTVLDQFLEPFKNIRYWLKAIPKGTTNALGTIVDSLLIWFFKLMANVIQIIADILLTILVMIGPLMMAFSIFDRWKGYIWTFIGQYIQLSLWKPIVAVICWCTTNANGVLCETIVGGTDGNFFQYIGNVLAAIATTCVTIVAGIEMLKQVPSIANSLVSLASGVSAGVNPMGTAGGAIGAAGGAMGAAGGAIGGISRGMHNFKGGLQGIQQGVGYKFGRDVAALDASTTAGSKIGGALGKVGSAIGKVGNKLR